MTILTELYPELIYLRVKCPAIDKNDENYLSVRFEYLVEWAPDARHGNKHKAH